MVSSLGTSAINAVGLCTQPRFIVFSAFMALGTGTTALVARAKGADNREEANHALRQSLLMAAGVGVLFCLLAFIGIIFVIVRALMFGDPTSGWPSMVCIMLLCSGVQLFCLGIVGEYLAKTYLEVKHRPIYITRETEQDRDERKPAQQK